MKNTGSNYKYDYTMLIDDVDLDNFIHEKLLRTYHFSKNIYVNTGTKSALEFLNNLSIMSQDFPDILPKIIFIDINMPMVDGFKFIDLFKQKLEKTVNKPKLVVLTSSVSDKDREKTMLISKDILFLHKPLTKEMLDGI